MNIKYYIKDENNDYVDRLSIFTIDGVYYYRSFFTFGNGCRRYLSKEKAQEVLELLQIHNKNAGMNHTFRIVEEIEEVKKLCEILDGLSSKFIEVDVIGTIKVPFFIEQFEWCTIDDYICFGEVDSENYPFKISISEITNIEFQEDFVDIILIYDIFKTIIRICLD